MTRSKYSRSVSKYVRRQKARIRKQTQNKEEQEKLIRDLIKRIDDQRQQK